MCDRDLLLLIFGFLLFCTECSTCQQTHRIADALERAHPPETDAGAGK